MMNVMNNSRVEGYLTTLGPVGIVGRCLTHESHGFATVEQRGFRNNTFNKGNTHLSYHLDPSVILILVKHTHIEGDT